MLVYTDLWLEDMKLDIIEKIIKEKNIKISSNILVYSRYGKDHENYDKSFKKIYYTPESQLDNKYADYVIGMIPSKLGPKKMYILLRNYERIELVNRGLTYSLYNTLNTNWIRTQASKKKSKFCCFIVSNPDGWVRNALFNKLSAYKSVDSMGKYKNNCNSLENIGRGNDKYFEIISEYKFIICCENLSKKHYITEKIYNAYKSGTIPIYWGAPNITDLFNINTFLNIEPRVLKKNQVTEIDKTVERVINLDKNDKLYNKMFYHTIVSDWKREDNRMHRSVKSIENILK